MPNVDLNNTVSLTAVLVSKLQQLSGALHEEVLSQGGQTMSRATVGAMIEKLLQGNLVGMATNPKAAIAALSVDLVKSLLEDALSKPIDKLTARDVLKFLDNTCVARPNAINGMLPNRTKATLPDAGGGGKPKADFLYDIRSLPTIVSGSNRELTAADKEKLFLHAVDEWVDRTIIKFTALKDNNATTKPNLVIACKPIDGSGRTLALSTFGQGGPLAGIDEYEIFINVTTPFTVEKFTAMMIHELGHVFGLDDNSDATSIMEGTLRQPYKNKPSDGDLNNLKALGW